MQWGFPTLNRAKWIVRMFIFQMIYVKQELEKLSYLNAKSSQKNMTTWALSPPASVSAQWF